MNECILVTGAAGFIGCEVALKLLERGDKVVGLDNLNDYYDVSLKEARLKRLTSHGKRFTFIKAALEDRTAIEDIFGCHKIDRVINLAGQVGVRYSLENPQSYIDSNIVGYLNILEACRHNKVGHLVYASSSSVYGANENMPFSEDDNVDHPVSLYAASKKANELMAHSYSHLYALPTTGLRFFTVYGPWGRPDMALFLFTRAILAGEPIRLFNHGQHTRDFTYIDDIVEAVVKVLDQPAAPDTRWNGVSPNPASSRAPWRVYNIGSNTPVNLYEYVETLEKALGTKAECELLPHQPGDVLDTYANVERLVSDFGYKPKTSIEEGILKFTTWYRDYYGL
ncbi:MAG: NAD-dependent epimerase [Pirellulaceae bacterium]